MRFNSIILTAFVASLMTGQVISSSVEDVNMIQLNDKLSRSIDESIANYEIRSIPVQHTKHGMVKRRHHVKRCTSDDDEKKDDKKKKKSDKKEKKTKKDDKKETKKDDDKKEKSTTKSSKDSQKDSSGSGSGVLGAAKGLFDMTFSGECPKPDATKESPNGNINFLNCGISKNNPNSKWSPPDVKMSQLKVISSDEAAKSGVFNDGCGKYKSAFDKASKETGVPAVILMSFSQQESSCNPSAKGGNGEIGMMQLTPDKCNSANCWDADTNVMMGAKYFKSLLDGFNGNVLEAIGNYNGWSKQMSYKAATNQQYGCASQNNLDYLNQLLNGWTQGKNGDKMLVYNNLGSC